VINSKVPSDHPTDNNFYGTATRVSMQNPESQAVQTLVKKD